MQKFTRPITREIEVGGGRVALTFSAAGISARPVGARSTPRQLRWEGLLCALAAAGKDPTADEVAAAVAILRGKPGSKKAAKAAVGTNAQGVKTQAPPLALPALLERLEGWLAKHRPRLRAALRPGANEKELHTLEGKLGLELPQELWTLLAWHDGQGEEFAGRFEENWLLMSAERIAAAKGELDREAAGNGEGNHWQPVWIPFLDDDSSDYLCVDTSQPGAPVRAFWLGQQEHPVIAPSLTAWFADFVAAVEAGEYHEEPERGTFLRRQAK